MRRLSRLSKECISHQGLCCENRLNAIWSDEEQEKLMDNKPIIKQCKYFKKPYCTIYNKRPLDCKVYPVTLDLRNNKVVFVIDLKCPAVKKGLIDTKFLNYAKRLFKNNWPDKSWIIRNSKDNKNKKMYKWITLEEYENKIRKK
jgi:Fe-S-cluster containining protein